jgi:opacity protein-like surface antigen
MHRSLCGGLLVAVLALLAVSESTAQETGTPMFKAPYRAFTNHEFGAAFSDPGEGVSYALEGFYSYGRGTNDFGLRGGIADPEEGDLRILLGGNFRTRVLNYSESFPLDGALTVGAGLNVGDGDDLIYLPVGLSVGRRFEMEGSSFNFTPYVHPTIIPVIGASGGSDVGFALGLGVDMRLGQNWAGRVSGGLGDLEGVGLALTYIQ